MKNTQVLLAKRPVGLPEKSTWSWEENNVPEPQAGQFTVEVKYISLDPAMRGWMNDRKSYVPPVGIGEVMRAGGVGRVVNSKNDAFSIGDYVCGLTGVQQFCTTDGKGYYKVDADAAPLEAYLGTLGMPGFTAYFGLLEIGNPQPGETLLVSAAAGAVGSVVGQIGKIKGCRVVGIAGGAAKCSYVVEDLGFDECIDYKNSNVYEEVRRTCPNGVDIYFDNVGGEILDIALANLNFRGRIPICGAISQYNAISAVDGPKNYLSLLVNSALMQGFIVFNYAKRYPEAAMTLGSWYKEGQLKSKEYIVEGIEHFYDAFGKLFDGKKLGKLVLKV
jgi:NADPH-dependent curcumin reductase CurA